LGVAALQEEEAAGEQKGLCDELVHGRSLSVMKRGFNRRAETMDLNPWILSIF
jgi:hypothetical protein